MTEALTKIVVNCETGEEQIVPLTAEEIAHIEDNAVAFAEAEAARLAEQAAKEAAKESAHQKLAALGLTPEEIQALSK